MLEGLFLAVTDAVFVYVIDKLDPAESIKKWLRREPARLAFQKALARAYTAFARQYPEYAASLFTTSFLIGAGAPELAKLLTRHLHPDPALFAQAWGTSIGFDLHSRFCQGTIKPAADFLKWLEAELKSEAVFQPLFDSRALESPSQFESQIEKLTTEPRHGFDTALKAANNYEKIILEIGGDVKDSNIVVGDHNQISVTKIYNHYYNSTFATLSDYYIAPDAIFQRVRVDEFVGREWLTTKVDAFLNDPNQKSGAFLLIGEAGVGKTSFLAHIVKERRYLHLFAEQVPGDANLQRALQSLGSQLVTRYQIDPYKDRDTLTQLVAFPDFLDKLLRLAANTLTEDEKIVIVCDALDEAGTFPNGNVFGLPNVLPDHVYFILSQQPVNTKLPNITPYIEKLDAQSGENLQDMEDYLKTAAKRTEIAGQIRSKNYSDEFFVRTLKEKSLGVWMYLHYIIKEIEGGSRAPLDLENLPTGLIGYYADYWDDWRHGRKGRGEGIKKWNEMYAPLLATLAVAQEPISIDTVIQWAEINANTREVRRLFQEDWRAFISERNKNGESIYTPYHASFRDFLTGKVDFTKLSPAQANLVRDLAEQTKEAHQRIVKVFRDKCNGNWTELVEQDYPRLYLATHLAEANEFKTLIILLTEGNEHIVWAEMRHKKEETYAGFLNDLEQVWKYAQAKDSASIGIRCMLIENSIRSLAGNLPPLLITELGKTGLWSYTRCLTTIKQIPEPYFQAEAIIQVVPNLPKTLLGEALSIAREIKDESIRADIFSEIIPYLSEENKALLLSDVREIKDESERASALTQIAPHLNERLKAQAIEEALAIAREIKDESDRASALTQIAPHLNKELKPQVLEEALATARQISFAREIRDESVRTRTLFQIASSLDGELKTQVLEEALAAARKIKDESIRALILSEIAPHLNGELKTQVLEEALTTARNLEAKSIHTDILSEIAPHLNEELMPVLLVAVREIRDESIRARTFSQIASHFNGEFRAQLLEEAFTTAREIKSKVRRALVFSEIAPQLNEELKTQALEEALGTARNIEEERHRAAIFSAIAPHINEDLKADLLSAIRDIKNEHIRAHTLSEITPYLNEELKTQALEEALSASRIINDEGFRAAFSKIAADLNEEHLKPVLLSAARETQEGPVPSGASSELPPQLMEEVEAIKEKFDAILLSSIHDIKNESIRPGIIARTISDFTGASVGETKVSLLQEAFLGDLTRSDLIKILDEWEKIQFKGLRESLMQFLKMTSYEDRKEGISRLTLLIPAIIHFEGKEISGEVLRAIIDTARWWP